MKLSHALPMMLLAATGAWAAEPAADKSQQAKAEQPAAKSTARDRIELEATQITGNKELPKVLYVVPWKRADLGDLAGKPANSLLDEVLSPVDRDVFRRQNRYFRALEPDSATPAQPAAAEGEK